LLARRQQRVKKERQNKSQAQIPAPIRLSLAIKRPIKRAMVKNFFASKIRIL
jgi:hypothetical protein